MVLIGGRKRRVGRPRIHKRKMAGASGGMSAAARAARLKNLAKARAALAAKRRMR